jgi:hypothetical protein
LVDCVDGASRPKAVERSLSHVRFLR